MSWNSLRHLATLDSLEARAENQASRATTANTRRQKAQKMKIFLRNRHRIYYVVKVANMSAREAAHRGKDKRGWARAWRNKGVCLLARGFQNGKEGLEVSWRLKEMGVGVTYCNIFLTGR